MISVAVQLMWPLLHVLIMNFCVVLLIAFFLESNTNCVQRNVASKLPDLCCAGTACVCWSVPSQHILPLLWGHNVYGLITCHSV